MATEPSLPPKVPGFAAKRKQPQPLSSVAINENESFKSVSIATPSGDVSKHFIGTPSAEGILSAFMNFDDAEGSTLEADFDFFNSKCQQSDGGDESFSSVSTRFPNSPCEFGLDKKSRESDSGREDDHGNQEEYEDDFEEDSDGERGDAHESRKSPTAVNKNQSEALSPASRSKLSPPPLTEVVFNAGAEVENVAQDAASEDGDESHDLLESIRFGLGVIEESANAWNIFKAIATPVSGSSGLRAISREGFETFAGYYGGCSPAAQGIEQLSNDLFDKLAVDAPDGSKCLPYAVFSKEFFPFRPPTRQGISNSIEEKSPNETAPLPGSQKTMPEAKDEAAKDASK